MALPFATEGNVKTISKEIAKEVVKEESTKVIANPTLAGTESALTGLQVGDEKFKIPQSISPYEKQIIIETSETFLTVNDFLNKCDITSSYGGTAVIKFIDRAIGGGALPYGNYIVNVPYGRNSVTIMGYSRIGDEYIFNQCNDLTKQFFGENGMFPSFPRNYAHKININLPNFPELPADASTKTYVCKAVNGTLTWVAE